MNDMNQDFDIFWQGLGNGGELGDACLAGIAERLELPLNIVAYSSCRVETSSEKGIIMKCYLSRLAYS